MDGSARLDAIGSTPTVQSISEGGVQIQDRAIPRDRGNRYGISRLIREDRLFRTTFRCLRLIGATDSR